MSDTCIITVVLRDSSDWKPLISLAEVLRAPLIKTEPENQLHSYHIISIRDFPPAGYLPRPERVIHIGEQVQRAKNFALQPYDVLVTIAGTIGHVTIAPPKCPRNWVPATNMFLVRFADDPDGSKSRTFYGLMKSSFGQDLMDTLAHGKGIQIVSKKTFSRTLLPPFTPETMQAFEKLWKEEMELYQRSMRLLEEANQVFAEAEVKSIVA